MEYEIKSISLASVFKISFLVVLTVSCIFIFIISMFAKWALSALGDSVGNIPLFENIDPAVFSFGGILFSSVFNGFMLTLAIMFFIMLAIIFYNIYVSYMGGIVMQIEPLENEQLIKQSAD
ncbi:MAG: hypothetical protein J7L86_02735 [Candidatus Marinimicrobia bacterium]|nr:hypothetical protein [Candidatus Neomarinimicrobiota bacterium]